MDRGHGQCPGCAAWGRDEPVVVGADRLGRLARPCGSGRADAWLEALAAPGEMRQAPKAAPGWAAAQRQLTARQGAWRCTVPCRPVWWRSRHERGKWAPGRGPAAVAGRRGVG